MIIFINTDNDAFVEDLHGETARILRVLADDLENGIERERLYDINGNNIGSVEY